MLVSTRDQYTNKVIHGRMVVTMYVLVTMPKTGNTNVYPGMV